MNRYGIVYYNNIECGIIKETEDGFIFTYNKEYLESSNAKPISSYLPDDEKKKFAEFIINKINTFK